MKLFYLIASMVSLSIQALQLTQQEIARVGRIIWQNECKQKKENLVLWNAHEEFPSLGIGHFIWHTKPNDVPFTQQFPELILFLKKNNIQVPLWMASPYAPWPDRKAFLSDRNSNRTHELLKILSETIDLQSKFIVHRFETQSMPKMLQMVSVTERNSINKQLQRLYDTPGGAFAVIDYVNFKGDGTHPQERYNKMGWGLLQVLLSMKEIGSPLQDFVTSAQEQLKQRVQNSPKERNEQRFLQGWNNRIKSYLSVK